MDPNQARKISTVSDIGTTTTNNTDHPVDGGRSSLAGSRRGSLHSTVSLQPAAAGGSGPGSGNGGGGLGSGSHANLTKVASESRFHVAKVQGQADFPVGPGNGSGGNGKDSGITFGVKGSADSGSDISGKQSDSQIRDQRSSTGSGLRNVEFASNPIHPGPALNGHHHARSKSSDTTSENDPDPDYDDHDHDKEPEMIELVASSSPKHTHNQSPTSSPAASPINGVDSAATMGSGGANEDTNYDCTYDTAYIKSLRRMTRDRLPRVSYYRDVRSIHTHLDRPTLDELHNPTIHPAAGGHKAGDTHMGYKALKSRRSPDGDPESGRGSGAGGMGGAGGGLGGSSCSPGGGGAGGGSDNTGVKSTALKLGWIQGVLVRCLLNIWGVILFIRLSWVVGQSGILCAILIILLASVVTTITTLSMSAICTNGEVKAGGTYYMISRSLGPQFGGAIGVIFSLANAVAVALYVVGFCETLQAILLKHGLTIVDGGLNDVRIIGTVTAVLLLGVSLVGMEWESKVQIFLLAILILSMLDFIIGTFIPGGLEKEVQGFFSYNGDIFFDNLLPNYTDGNNFITVFAIFFPAATGILAGANISGDLMNPSKSIPKGTLLAIVISTASYIFFAVLCGATVMRESNGSFNEFHLLRNCSLIIDGEPLPCNRGLLHDKQIMEMVSLYGPVISAGIFAATLSSALASLVSAPKVFQALCKDRLFPYIHVFEKGFNASPEPHRAYFLTFVIAVVGILIGKLDAIAPLISNFFLAAYCLINASCFHASISRMPGFRPSFKYYNKWVSLVGSALSIIIMLLSNWVTAVLTIVLIVFLYAYLHYRKPDVNWGSSTQSESYMRALKAVEKLSNVQDHVKTYRPQILVLSGRPAARPALVDFATAITKKISLLMCGQVIVNPNMNNHRHNMSNGSAAGGGDGPGQGHGPGGSKSSASSIQVIKAAERQLHKQRATTYLKNRRIKAFYALKEDESFSRGAKSLMELTGLGQLKPNVVLLGWKSDWDTCPIDELNDYVETIHYAFDLHLSLAILRLPDPISYEEYAGQIERLSQMPINYDFQPVSHPEGDAGNGNGNGSGGGSGPTVGFNRNMSYAQISMNSSIGGTPQSTPMLGRARLGLTKNPSSFVTTSPGGNGITGSGNTSGIGSGQDAGIQLSGPEAAAIAAVNGIKQAATAAAAAMITAGRRKSEADVGRHWANLGIDHRTSVDLTSGGVSGGAGGPIVTAVDAKNEPITIPAEILNQINIFARKQPKKSIDVWWLFDDGGLTILIPHLLTLRSQWKNCPIRVFTLANRKDELDRDKRNMATLLSKFRIDFTTVNVIADIHRPPRDESMDEFHQLISKWIDPEGDADQPSSDVSDPPATGPGTGPANGSGGNGLGTHERPITDSELLACRDKSRRHIRLRELLLQHSSDAALIVMTLTIPRRGTCSAPLFLSWLETLTRDMPPFLLIRGNQTSVLTFYS